MNTVETTLRAGARSVLLYEMGQAAVTGIKARLLAVDFK